MSDADTRAQVTTRIIEAARELSLAAGYRGWLPSQPSTEQLTGRFAAEPLHQRLGTH